MFEKVVENDFSRRRKRLAEDRKGAVSKSSSRIQRFIVRRLVYIIKETRFQDVTSLSLLLTPYVSVIDDRACTYVLQLKKIHTWSFICVPSREPFPIFRFYKLVT